MNIAQIEENLQNLIANFSEEEFIYDLMLAYGLPKNTVTLLKKGNRNLAKKDDQIVLKKKLFFERVSNQDLHGTIDALRKNEETFRHDPRFIVVTDFKTLLSIDNKTDDTLDIPIKDIAKHFDFFLPWAGMEKAQLKTENPADVKAAERMAKLYDEILKDNPFKKSEELHGLNVFLSRLLFCFFAEDTGIFAKSSFTGSIASHTQPDGDDLDSYLNRLFEVLNTQDRGNQPEYLKAFPYVNGGLFGHKYFAPQFTRKSRKMIIDCGELDWSAINPDIFGSMIQAVVHSDQRSGMGMHYTSVPNIMKVIEPLFLNELREEFEKHHDNKGKLEQLLARLEKISIFDPACGSGNFLIIAYKELRKLEIDIFLRINELSPAQQLPLSRIKLSQFYGIELDDFAHEVAILSLWLAEHQMNVRFKEVFGQTNPSLPLREGGNIVCGNATRLNWADVCPKPDRAEIYILGNPPYLGSSMQSPEQKEDMAFVFSGNDNYKKQDYISCWFYKAAQYIDENMSFGFVTTNSVCQGTQVEMTWPLIFDLGLEISFAHKDFKWSNSAKGKAGVICSIIGIRHRQNKPKFLFKDTMKEQVANLNAYLVNGPDIIVEKRKSPLSALPKMTSGNKPLDGGHLVLSTEEKDAFLNNDPRSKPFLKKFIGSYEFINGADRWCLWIPDNKVSDALGVSDINDRVNQVREFRLSSGNNARNKAKTSHRFEFANEPKVVQIIVPRVSSERRTYVPMGFLGPEIVVADSAQVIFDPEPFVFGVMTSLMHMIWMRVTSGRLKSDYRYSSETTYNTFPIPNLTDKQKQNITQHVYNVLEEREKHPEKTMSDLYDPDTMPDGLREAHRNLDLAVERCYRSRPFTSDEERLEFLFKLYEAMVSGSDPQGELLYQAG